MLRSKALVLSFVFVGLIITACGKKGSSSSNTPGATPGTTATPNGSTTAIVGIWKTDCIPSATQSSLRNRYEFKANGEINRYTQIFLVKTDCSGEEDYSYRLNGKYSTSNLPFSGSRSQALSASFGNDVYFTLKTDATVQAFNGGTPDSTVGTWQKGVEQKSSGSVAAEYAGTVNTLNQTLKQVIFRVDGKSLSFQGLTDILTKE